MKIERTIFAFFLSMMFCMGLAHSQGVRTPFDGDQKIDSVDTFDFRCAVGNEGAWPGAGWRGIDGNILPSVKIANFHLSSEKRGMRADSQSLQIRQVMSVEELREAAKFDDQLRSKIENLSDEGVSKLFESYPQYPISKNFQVDIEANAKGVRVRVHREVDYFISKGKTSSDGGPLELSIPIEKFERPYVISDIAIVCFKK